MQIIKWKLVSEFHLFHNSGALTYKLKKASFKKLPISFVYMYIYAIVNAGIQTMMNLRELRRKTRRSDCISNIYRK